MRHFSSGIAWAKAGDARTGTAAAMPAFLINPRRSIKILPRLLYYSWAKPNRRFRRGQMPRTAGPTRPDVGVLPVSGKLIRVRINYALKKWLTETEAGGPQLRRIEA